VTVNDLITAALRRIRVVSGSDPPDGDAINDSLLRFNDWLDDLKNEDFLDLFERRVTWPLVPGKASYSMGTGGGQDVQADLITSATDIHNIGYVDATGADILLPLISNDAYAAIPQKNTIFPGALPQYWFANPDPAATLFPWPIPGAPGLKGLIFLGQLLQEVTVNTVLTLPPGYRRFLRDGLALELAPEFHVNDPAVLGPLKLGSDEARANIKRKKRRPMQVLVSPVEFGYGGVDNIYSGP
jgi:hypothetical protein